MLFFRLPFSDSVLVDVSLSAQSSTGKFLAFDRESRELEGASQVGVDFEDRLEAVNVRGSPKYPSSCMISITFSTFLRLHPPFTVDLRHGSNRFSITNQ